MFVWAPALFYISGPLISSQPIKSVPDRRWEIQTCHVTNTGSSDRVWSVFSLHVTNHSWDVVWYLPLSCERGLCASVRRSIDWWFDLFFKKWRISEPQWRLTPFLKTGGFSPFFLFPNLDWPILMLILLIVDLIWDPFSICNTVCKILILTHLFLNCIKTLSIPHKPC